MDIPFGTESALVWMPYNTNKVPQGTDAVVVIGLLLRLRLLSLNMTKINGRLLESSVSLLSTTWLPSVAGSVYVPVRTRGTYTLCALSNQKVVT